MPIVSLPPPQIIPIGGVKEKLLAAERADATCVILPGDDGCMHALRCLYTSILILTHTCIHSFIHLRYRKHCAHKDENDILCINIMKYSWKIMYRNNAQHKTLTYFFQN